MDSLWRQIDFKAYRFRAHFAHGLRSDRSQHMNCQTYIEFGCNLVQKRKCFEFIEFIIYDYIIDDAEDRSLQLGIISIHQK